MIYFNSTAGPMLAHVKELADDAMATAPQGYDPEDEQVAAKLGQLAEAGTALVVTGQPASIDERRRLIRKIIEAEANNWVPDASQLLICRASRALGFFAPEPRTDDHGPDEADHATISNWIGGLYVRHCATCCRIFIVTDTDTGARLY